MQCYKIVSKCFEYNIEETLSGDFIYLVIILYPNINKTNDILPTIRCILSIVKEVKWNLIDHLHCNIHKNKRLDPVLKNLSQSEILLFRYIEFMMLINHHHADEDIP